MTLWAARYGQAAAEFLSVPWPSFVAAFLYYTLLTALVLGGVSPAWMLLAGAYAAPLVLYALQLTWRLVTAFRSLLSRRPLAPLAPAHAPLAWQ